MLWHHRVKHHDHGDRREQQSISRLLTVPGRLHYMSGHCKYHRQALTYRNIVVNDQDRSHGSIQSSEVISPDISSISEFKR
jgi:hypothetical protein